MKATDQIYPFFEWNEPGFGDAITVDPSLGRQWFPFNRGMDLRTYLAGQAMQGLLSIENANYSPRLVANASVQYADALIEELNKEKK